MIEVAILFNNLGPYHVARCQAARQHPDLNIHVIELASSEQKYPWEADKTKLGTSLHTLSGLPYERSDVNLMCRDLRITLEKIMPDVVAIAGYSEKPMRVAASWARQRDRKVVLMSETTAWDKQRHRVLEVAKRLWIRRFVDEAFVGGTPHVEYALSIGLSREHIWTGYDVVDNGYFSRNALELRNSLPQEPRSFLFVGRLAPEKNVETLLHAFRRYKDATDAADWDLVIVGDGPSAASLRGLANALGLLDVRWAGFTLVDELPQRYAEASCFVLPSTKEPWGLVVNEAMASGLPVLISKACGSATDLVQEGINGFTFDPKSPDELASLMRLISQEPTDVVRMGRESIDIIGGYTPTRWANAIFEASTAAQTI